MDDVDKLPKGIEHDEESEQVFPISRGHGQFIVNAMQSLLEHQNSDFITKWQEKIREWESKASIKATALSISFLQALYSQHGSKFDTAQGEIFQAMINEIGNDSTTILGSIEILRTVEPSNDRVSNINKTAKNILLKGAIMHQLTPLFDGLNTDTKDTPPTSFASYYRDWQEGKIRIREVLQDGASRLPETPINNSISQIVNTIIADAL